MRKGSRVVCSENERSKINAGQGIDVQRVVQISGGMQGKMYSLSEKRFALYHMPLRLML